MIYTIEEAVSRNAIIKVIGIGGGGCNAVNRMMEMNLGGIDFIACNTDTQTLMRCKAPTLIPLGRSGLGAGGKPQAGREAALEDEDTIRSFLENAEMVFITAGMGGGTGTGGAPVVAEIARELHALTVAVVTKPFYFEGPKRMQIAEAGIKNLEEFVDTLIIIPNQNLLSTVEHDTPLTDAFRMADDVLCNAVQGISELITVHGSINLDFEDVRTIMSGMGKALMGTGYGTGEKKAEDAVRRAIVSPLLDDMNIKGARSILINVTAGDDLGLIELNDAVAIIRQDADKEAHIIFGLVTDKEYRDKVKVTIIATGFDASRTIEKPLVKPFPESSRPLPIISTRSDYDSSHKIPSESPHVNHALTSFDLSSGRTETESQEEHTVSLQPAQSSSGQAPKSKPTPLLRNEDPMESDDRVHRETMAESQPIPKPSIEKEPDAPNQSEVDEQSQRSEASIGAMRTEPMGKSPQILAPVSPTPRNPIPRSIIASAEPAAELNLPEENRTVPPPINPELDLSSSGNTIRFAHTKKLPPYTSKNLGKGEFNRKTELADETIKIENPRHLIPAFLRRKSD